MMLLGSGWAGWLDVRAPQGSWMISNTRFIYYSHKKQGSCGPFVYYSWELCTAEDECQVHSQQCHWYCCILFVLCSLQKMHQNRVTSYHVCIHKSCSPPYCICSHGVYPDPHPHLILGMCFNLMLHVAVGLILIEGKTLSLSPSLPSPFP